MAKKLTEIAFFTDQVAEMTAFYRQFLGQEPAAAWPGGVVFMLGEVRLFLHETYEADDEHPLPPVNHIAFAVEDVDAAADDLRRAGLAIERNPADYYWGRSAYLRDPDGYQIEITGEKTD